MGVGEWAAGMDLRSRAGLPRALSRAGRERLEQGLGEWFGAVSAEAFIDCFQAPDQIQHVASSRWSAGRGAKMGAATEGTGAVNEAEVVWPQQRAGAVSALRQSGASGGPQSAGEFPGFSPGQVRYFPSLAEMAAGGPVLAIAVQRPCLQHFVDGANLRQRAFPVGGRPGRRLGLTTHELHLSFASLRAQPRRMKFHHLLALAFSLPLLACGDEPSVQATAKQPAGPPVTAPPMTETQQTATFANGCFWCTEAVFQRIKGVDKVVSGYIGGAVKNPTYEDICEGTSGHAEAVQLTFNPKTVTFDQLLEVFWASHDPTTLNRQGHDVGTQYRSGIFYHSDEQKKAAEESKTKHQPQFADPIVTEITPAEIFYPAEKYHQNYFNLNGDKNPYCRIVIWPKLKKLGLEIKPVEAPVD